MSLPKSEKCAIHPTRDENYPEWYQQVIKAADMAEISPVRGCMIIKPWGYAIWENIQSVLDSAFKCRGTKNVYFPLMIPLSFLQKEAEHIEGFAKECAVVTHHRLIMDKEGKLIPASPLEEPYVIRPTSETIIGDAFARWIQSYRDLPLNINQWANIVRWEMRTRLFLRTTEFLWQEGHTAHATREEAISKSHEMLDVYARFAEEYLAMPVIKGEKTPSERFPGAEHTYCIEALMQDNKALQAGTSHFLGQHFSRGFNIKYLNENGQEEFVWTTSWGASTRLIGGLVMTHSDDNGLVLPPKIAPLHAVILPIIHDENDRISILEYCEALASALRDITYDRKSLAVEIDQRDLPGGEKMWSWIKKGVPIRLEIGKKEIAANTVFIGQRNQSLRERYSLNKDELLKTVSQLLETIQSQLLQNARMRVKENTYTVTHQEDFYQLFKEKNGGFVYASWCGDESIEAKIKTDLNVTIRCLPFAHQHKEERCIFTGKPSVGMAVFAKAY